MCVCTSSVAVSSPCYFALVVVWDESKYLGVGYGERETQSEQKFRPAFVPQCLKEGLFLACVDFVPEINSVTHQLSSWMEECFGHEYFLVDETTTRPNKRRRRHWHNPDVRLCIMKCRHLPELAAGRSCSLLPEACAQSYSRIALCGKSVDQRSRALLQRDLLMARAFLAAHLTVKID